MFKKTEEMYGAQDEDSSDEDNAPRHTEIANQRNLFEKARAMSDNGNNMFSDQDSDKSDEDVSKGNKFDQFKNSNSDEDEPADKVKYGSRNQVEGGVPYARRSHSLADDVLGAKKYTEDDILASK